MTGAGAGAELYRWLDGDEGQLSAVLEASGQPVVFEVRGPRSVPGPVRALLGAPFEVLAVPDGGFQRRMR